MSRVCDTARCTYKYVNTHFKQEKINISNKYTWTNNIPILWDLKIMNMINSIIEAKCNIYKTIYAQNKTVQ